MTRQRLNRHIVLLLQRYIGNCMVQGEARRQVVCANNLLQLYRVTCEFNGNREAEVRYLCHC